MDDKFELDYNQKLIQNLQEMNVFSNFKNDDKEGFWEKHCSAQNFIKKNFVTSVNWNENKEKSIKAMNKSYEKRVQTAKLNKRQNYNNIQQRHIMFINRPMELRDMRIHKEEMEFNARMKAYKGLHWLYLIYILNYVQIIRHRLKQYRVNMFFEKRTDKILRKAQLKMKTALLKEPAPGVSAYTLRQLFIYKNTMNIACD